MSHSFLRPGYCSTLLQFGRQLENSCRRTVCTPHHTRGKMENAWNLHENMKIELVFTNMVDPQYLTFGFFISIISPKNEINSLKKECTTISKLLPARKHFNNSIIFVHLNLMLHFLGTIPLNMWIWIGSPGWVIEMYGLESMEIECECERARTT